MRIPCPSGFEQEGLATGVRPSRLEVTYRFP